MATVINKISTNYNVANESETLVMNGSFNYTDKINDLRLDVYENGTYIGNIYYTENEGENATMNMNVDMNHFMSAFTQLNNIITDINEQVKD